MKEKGPLHYFWHPAPGQIPSRIIFGILNVLVWVISIVCVVLALQWVDKPFPGFLVNERMVISDFGSFYWSGVEAGLRLPDKVLKVEGSTVQNSADLYEVVSLMPIGTTALYAIDRRGTVREVPIPTMRFTWFDLSITFGVTFLCGLVYLTLGFLVYILKQDTRMTWAFLLACLFLGLYALTSFDIQSTHWGFIRLALLAHGFIPAAFLHLSFVFPEQRTLIIRYPSLQFVPYLLALFFVVPIELLYPDPRFQTLVGLNRIYTIFSAIALLASTLWSFLKGSSIIAKQRAKVVLFGALLAFPLPVIGQYIGISEGTIGGRSVQNNLFAIPLLLFPAAISYSITRHNLFDVDVYIKRAVGYALMTTILGGLYFLLQTGLRTMILDPLFGGASEQVYPILFALLVVFFFNPVNQFVQNFIDEVFFRKSFDYKDTIASVSTALTSLLDKQAIIFKLINIVRTNMFVDSVGVFVDDSHREDLSWFSLREHHGQPQNLNQITEQHLSKNDPLYLLVRREKKLITKYDVQESPSFADVREKCGSRFSQLGASLLLPLFHQNEVTGMMALGYKKSGHFYSREDVELLETLTNQGATALENAKLADQMKHEEGVRANLARYLSPQIVDQIIEQDVQVNLGGDRKVVTVLFSDIRNFTSITESRPPDQLVSILNEYFTEMATIIFEHKGSLDKYIGDAIVAVFGSLIPLENSALHATRAAVQMIKRMPDLNARWQREFGFGMDIGIGVNTGEVFLGNIGSPERMEFTVIGDTVNVASRFSGLAKGGQVLLTREAFSALGRSIPHRQLPSAKVKGKAEKLEVFEALCN